MQPIKPRAPGPAQPDHRRCRASRSGRREDHAARTGVTVVLPDDRAVCRLRRAGRRARHARDRCADALENLVEAVDAVVLSGGSVYGLGAADGVRGLAGRAGAGLWPGAPGIPPSPVVPGGDPVRHGQRRRQGLGRGPALPPSWASAAIGDRRAATSSSARPGAGYGAMAGGAEGRDRLGLGGHRRRAHAWARWWRVNCWGSVVAPGGADLLGRAVRDGRRVRRPGAAGLARRARRLGPRPRRPGDERNTTIACVATRRGPDPRPGQAGGGDGPGRPGPRDPPDARAVRRGRGVRAVHRRPAL